MNKVGNVKLFFIIINSVIGGGLFVNLGLLSSMVGSYSGILYLVGYLVFFPIIFCIGNLASKQQLEGGLYFMVESRLGALAGFLTSWSYFLGRSVSAAVLLKMLAVNLAVMYPSFRGSSELALATMIAAIMIAINILGISNAGRIQYFFTSFKIMPIIILSIIGLSFFAVQNFNFSADLYLVQKNFFSALPSYIFAIQGFTIVIHIGHLIKEPKQLLTTLIAATFCAALIGVIFQSIVFSATTSAGSENALQAFFSMFHFKNIWINFVLKNIINIAVGASCFMILTGNSKNLVALANNNYLPCKKLFLIGFNNVAFFSLFVHAFISLSFLALAQNTPALQSASVFANFFAYFLCVIAAIKDSLFTEKNIKMILFAIIALCCNLFVLKISFDKILNTGLSLEFLFLFCIGIFFVAKRSFFSKPE